MNNHAGLDDKGVLERLAAGHLPVLDASYSFKSVYPDGTEVSHQVMSRIALSHDLQIPRARGVAWSLPIAHNTPHHEST